MMNKKNLLKILALIVGPLLPLVIGAYFLFPYLNKTEYQKVVKQYKKEHGNGTTITPSDDSVVKEVIEDSMTLDEGSKAPLKSITRLRSKVDSIKAVNDSLSVLLLAKEKKIDELKKNYKAESDSASSKPSRKSKITDKKFTENMKSLMALDLEQLAPIIKEMSDKEVVLLYKSGSSLQKRKLLQSLKASRAAKLMKEVL